ncbi:MAG: hypothetical protein VW405_15505 [Rhodospirillaceae bacterium]
MTESVRRLHQFSSDPMVLAGQVGELARDLDQRTRYTFSEVKWAGVVTLGKKWRVDVGRTKPVAIVAIDAYDETNRRGELPGAVQWQWVDGQAQIDDIWTPFAGGSECRVTFLVIHRAG